MKDIFNKIKRVFTTSVDSPPDTSPVTSEIDEDDFWQQVYDARAAYYEKHIGQLPDDILKMGNMMGVWPGGGLFVIPADKIANDLWAYTTFGISNPDMPASTVVADYTIETDEQDRPSEYSGSLHKKKPAQNSVGVAGYGYEMVMITKENTEWPLSFIQWAVNAEIQSDTDILNRVEQYNGLTVADIEVSESESINVLIEKARNPLPGSVQLPNGKMELLIATVITDDEMQWSLENGRNVLLAKLIESGVGQISDRNRKSIL